MITKTEKKKLTEHLKNNYVEDVAKVLASQRVTTRSGKPYSDVMIRKVLNGYQHAEIEDAILIVYELRKNEYNKLQEKKERILSE